MSSANGLTGKTANERKKPRSSLPGLFCETMTPNILLFIVCKRHYTASEPGFQGRGVFLSNLQKILFALPLADGFKHWSVVR